MASSVHNNNVTHAGRCMCCKVCNMWCWRAFKWIPVLLIVSIVTWSYYAYVYQLCISTVDSTVQRCIYLILYHILLVMFAWSYWRTIFAVIEPVPERFKLPETELEKLLSADSEDAQRTILENFAKDLPIVSRTSSGSVRYCNRCVLIKPDRAHHCSICSRCVLKMDHHCPWVNNCVCFFNYKFFVLFLGYALLYCLFITATSLPYFIKFWKGEFATAAAAGRYHIVFAFFVSLMFGVSLGSLFGYHLYLVFNNRTTLDVYIERRSMAINRTHGYYARTKIGGWSITRSNTPESASQTSVKSSPTTALNMEDESKKKGDGAEAFRAPTFRGGADKNGFSIGYFNNFKEVFGNNPHLWLMPVSTSLGDGCDFPVRREHELQAFTAPQEPQGYESMGTTRSSFGDGIVYPLAAPEEDTESLLSAERWDRWGERARPFDDRESSSYDEL